MIECCWCEANRQEQFEVMTVIHDTTGEKRFVLKCRHCLQPLLAAMKDGTLAFVEITNIPPSAQAAIDEWNELV